MVAKDIHPNEAAREERLKRITLEDAFEDFLACRKNLKLLTLRDYRRAMNTAFKDWRRRLLTDISKGIWWHVGMPSLAKYRLRVRIKPCASCARC